MIRRIVIMLLFVLGVATPARAITPTVLTFGSHTTLASAYQTHSAAYTTGDLTLVFISNSRASPVDLPSSIGLDGGMTGSFTQHVARDYDTNANPTDGLTVWRSSNITGTGSLTINFPANQTACKWFIIQVSGIDTTTNDGVANQVTNFADIADTSGSLTFSAFANSNNRPIAMFDTNSVLSIPHDWATDGWTKLAERSVLTPDSAGSIGWLDTADTTISVLFSASDRWGAVGLELTATGAGTAGVNRLPPPMRTLMGVGR